MLLQTSSDSLGRKEGFSAGELEGAGKASMAISGFYLELDEFEQALKWCTKARKEFGEGGSAARGENNMTLFYFT